MPCPSLTTLPRLRIPPRETFTPGCNPVDTVSNDSTPRHYSTPRPRTLAGVPSAWGCSHPSSTPLMPSPSPASRTGWGHV